MIRVVSAAEPEGFDESVRQPGLLALRELAGDPTVPNRAGPKRKHAPDLWTGPFLDPFEIESDWFELDLATFRVRARVEVTRAAQGQWDHRLRVLNEPTFCEARRWYHERYFGRRLDAFDPETPMSLDVLQVQAPFVARELVRQGRLRGSCQDEPL